MPPRAPRCACATARPRRSQGHGEGPRRRATAKGHGEGRTEESSLFIRAARAIKIIASREQWILARPEPDGFRLDIATGRRGAAKGPHA
jgi:hypothetical protein